MNWLAKTIVESPHLHRVQLLARESPLTIGSMLVSLQSDAAFRTFFANTLAASPFAGFRWEMPALTDVSVHKPCEFILQDAPRLSTDADPDAFAQHFRAAPPDQWAVAFSNLGKDAILIAPTPREAHAAYAHFAVFLRNAPEPQKQALLALVGEVAMGRISKAPFRLSTAGCT